ncbi:hypothetical protein SCALM49S_00593 [Streptomyces californicus]
MQELGGDRAGGEVRGQEPRHRHVWVGTTRATASRNAPTSASGSGSRGAPGAGRRGRVFLGRQRGGDRAQVRDVLGVPGAGPPGVVAVRREAGQEPAARDEVQGVQRGGAPAAGGGVGGGQVPGPYEQGQRVLDGQQRHGRLGRAHLAGAGRRVRPDDREPAGGVRDGVAARPRRRPRRAPRPAPALREPSRRVVLAVRVPEGDPAVPGHRSGQEERRAAQQTGGVGAPGHALGAARSARTGPRRHVRHPPPARIAVVPGRPQHGMC